MTAPTALSSSWVDILVVFVIFVIACSSCHRSFQRLGWLKMAGVLGLGAGGVVGDDLGGNRRCCCHTCRRHETRPGKVLAEVGLITFPSTGVDLKLWDGQVSLRTDPVRETPAIARHPNQNARPFDFLYNLNSITIDADSVQTFCAIVGNQAESFKAVRSTIIKAPMDFAIVTGWQAIMKSIFPSTIDGDLLRLVHLSNGFCMVEGAKPLQVRDICKAEARILSITNTNEGKIVKVKGHVYREGKAVVEVISSFLYRGQFSDYHNTFETTEESDYLVSVLDDAAVGVLQSKEWFVWDDESKPLLAGTSLIFRIRWHATFKDKVSYRDLPVAGDVFVRNQLKRLVKVDSVDFKQDNCKGNPVLSYLQRHGTAQGLSTPLATGEYTLASTDNVFNAPLTNEPYSKRACLV